MSITKLTLKLCSKDDELKRNLYACVSEKRFFDVPHGISRTDGNSHEELTMFVRSVGFIDTHTVIGDKPQDNEIEFALDSVGVDDDKYEATDKEKWNYSLFLPKTMRCKPFRNGKTVTSPKVYVRFETTTPPLPSPSLPGPTILSTIGSIFKVW